jgi:hypothetical protein
MCVYIYLKLFQLAKNYTNHSKIEFLMEQDEFFHA